MGETAFRVNTPEVMSETIDGEVIAINLSSGTYYSIAGTGSVIWQLLDGAAATRASDVVEALAERFAGERAEMEGAVASFLGQLRNEGLVAPADAGDVSRPQVVTPEGESKPMFEPPKLETFTDMQDLVLLDPVHQVDETGWPQRPPVADRGGGR